MNLKSFSWILFEAMKETSTIDDINVMESVKYDFISIQNATNNFSEANKIGRGSFGPVYKVNLALTTIVTVMVKYNFGIFCLFVYD